MLTPSSGTQLPTPEDRDHTLAVLYTDPDGTFTGALMPMRVPLDTTSQWQGMLRGLIGHLSATEPKPDLDGLYALRWWSDPTGSLDAGLILTRTSYGEVTEDDLTRPLHDDTLGLLMVVTGPEAGTRSAILGIRGYLNPDGVSRPDRRFGVIFTDTGAVMDSTVDPRARTTMGLLASILVDTLDRDLEQRR